MKNWFLVTIVLCNSLLAFSVEDSPCYPRKDNDRLVYDMANLLDQSQRDQLEVRLKEFAISTSNQVVIVITDDLCGMDISQFGSDLIELWGIGQAKEDNGIVITLKPKRGDGRGEVNISTGRGLEGILPDGQCWLIEQNEMLPSFKQNDYYGGISRALDVITSLAAQEYTITEYAAKHSKKKERNIAPYFLISLVILIVLVFRIGRARRYARRNGIDWWTAWLLLNQAGSRHRGYWGDFSGGRGGFGGWSGGGGGGFGGFGGGSSGGGGASSSW